MARSQLWMESHIISAGQMVGQDRLRSQIPSLPAVHPGHTTGPDSDPARGTVHMPHSTRVAADGVILDPLVRKTWCPTTQCLGACPGTRNHGMAWEGPANRLTLLASLPKVRRA